MYLQVVGVHMVGPDAPEIMQGIAIALKAGAKKSHFDMTVGIHPSAAEEFVTMRSRTRRIQGKGKGWPAWAQGLELSIGNAVTESLPMGVSRP